MGRRVRAVLETALGAGVFTFALFAGTIVGTAALILLIDRLLG